MKLIRKQPGIEVKGPSGIGQSIDRRTFLKRSGLAMGTGAAATVLAPGRVKKAHAASADAGGEITIKVKND